MEWVPVTFVCDSIINKFTTHEEIRNEESAELTSSLKRFEFSPQKGGYTPERHPTKKQKTLKSMRDVPLESSSDSDDNDKVDRPRHKKTKSFKELLLELTNAADSELTLSSDSDDEFNKHVKPLYYT
jgi:hypothetical protein